MAVYREEYCKKVGGVRLEWDLGCGPDCAKDAMCSLVASEWRAVIGWLSAYQVTH